MTVQQSRCPYCHSAFYITSLQLKAYQGQARCGQCHQIFDAIAHRIMPAQTSPASPHPTASADPTASAQTTPSSAAATPLAPSSPGREAATPPTPAAERSSVPDPHPNQLFSDEQGLEEADSPSAAATAFTPASPHNSTPFIDATIDEDFLASNFDSLDRLKSTELSQVDSLHDAADESWLNDLLADETPAPSLEQPVPAGRKTTSSPDHQPAPAASPIDRGVYAKLPDAIQRSEIDEDEDLLSFLNRTGAVSMPLSSPDRDNLSTPKPASHRILKPQLTPVKPHYVLGWSIMCLLMAALLAGQYIYFNFEKLALNPRTLPLLSQLCSVTGCQIPYMNSQELHIKKLRLSVLRGTGYTQFRGQISNSATRSQPFPALLLTLSKDGQIIASRTIQPRQYLPSELKTLSRLATRTPYPFAFTIKTKRSDFDDYSLVPQYP